MKIRIDYHYTISCLPHRCQSQRTASAAASCEVEIAEVAAEDAPVVMRVRNPEGRTSDRHSERFSAKEDGSPREIRMFRGLHFVEGGSAEGLAAAASGGASVDQTFFGRCKPRNTSIDRPIPGHPPQKPITADDLVRREMRMHPGPVRSVSDDGGERMAGKLRKLADLMIVIDGAVFEYVPEPILRIKRDEGARIVPRPQRKGAEHDPFDFHPYDYYRERKSALKFAESPGEGEGGLFFEVFDPRASTFDGTTYEFSKRSEAVVSALAKEAFLLNRGMLAAYHDLREASDAAGGQVTPALVEAMRGFLDATVEEAEMESALAMASRLQPHEGWGSRDRFEDLVSKRAAFLANRGGAVGYAFSDAAEALSIWESRPVSAHWDHRAGYVSSVVHERMSAVEILSEGGVADLAFASGASFDELMEAVADGHTVVSVLAPHHGAAPLAAVLEDGREPRFAGPQPPDERAVGAVTALAAARVRPTHADETDAIPTGAFTA